MDPIKTYVDNVVAEAIAGGKSAEEAEALRAPAEEEAKRIAAHPLFQGFERHARQRFTEHDTLKKEVAPLKTAAQKLKELEEKDLTESQRIAKELDELKPKATRAEALVTMAQELFDEATADLTDEQKAVIVGDTPEAKLKHFRALVKAGVFEQEPAYRSPGAGLPRKGGANEMKVEELVGDGTDVSGFAERQKLIKDKKKILVTP